MEKDQNIDAENQALDTEKTSTDEQEEVTNQKTLEKPKKSNENFNIFIAYYLDKIRLIDNI